MKAGPGDSLIFYFSGHGVGDQDTGYLVPIDARLKTLTDESVSLGRVRDFLKDSGADVVFLVLDACHSGLAEVGGPEGAMTEGFEKTVVVGKESQQPAPGKGWIALTSCASGEYSYPLDTTKPFSAENRSAFTHYLLEGLAGQADAFPQDEIITVRELNEYVHRKVADWAVSAKVSQEPQIKISGSGAVTELALLSTYDVARLGTIQVNSYPPAEVYLDDATEAAGETPLALPKLEPASHKIRLWHPRFGEDAQTVELEPGKKLAVHRDFQRPPAADPATAPFVRRFWDADFFGAEEGLRALLAGRRLTQKGQVLAHQYLAFCLVARGSTDEAVEQFLSLLKVRPDHDFGALAISHTIATIWEKAKQLHGKEAYIRIPSPTGATVKLDGMETRKRAPTTLTVEAGRHTVRLEMEGQPPWEESISVSVGETVEAKGPLAPPPPPAQPAYLYIQNPSGALIKVDGIDTRLRVPATVEVQPGTHAVRLDAPGEVWKGQVSVSPGETLETKLGLHFQRELPRAPVTGTLLALTVGVGMLVGSPYDSNGPHAGLQVQWGNLMISYGRSDLGEASGPSGLFPSQEVKVTEVAFLTTRAIKPPGGRAHRKSRFYLGLGTARLQSEAGWSRNGTAALLSLDFGHLGLQFNYIQPSDSLPSDYGDGCGTACMEYKF